MLHVLVISWSGLTVGLALVLVLVIAGQRVLGVTRLLLSAWRRGRTAPAVVPVPDRRCRTVEPVLVERRRREPVPSH